MRMFLGLSLVHCFLGLCWHDGWITSTRVASALVFSEMYSIVQTSSVTSSDEIRFDTYYSDQCFREGGVKALGESVGSVKAAQSIDHLHCQVRDRKSASLTPYISSHSHQLSSQGISQIKASKSLLRRKVTTLPPCLFVNTFQASHQMTNSTEFVLWQLEQHQQHDDNGLGNKDFLTIRHIKGKVKFDKSTFELI